MEFAGSWGFEQFLRTNLVTAFKELVIIGCSPTVLPNVAENGTQGNRFPFSFFFVPDTV